MTPAEHHLGDRLAALVDGELGHDARERVLAHLATCEGCKAEADAQRRLKNVFSAAAPPPPSEGFLARLQGLPASDVLGPQGPDDFGPGPGGPGASPAERGELGALAVAGLSGGSERSPWAFEYLPVSGDSGRGPLTPQRGFRIHETPRVDRPERLGTTERERAERERSASRGRRFAFAAAGAFSLAALAFGGTLASGATGGGTGAGGDSPSANSVRSTGSTGSGTGLRDTRRRGGEPRSGTLSSRTAPGPTFAPAATARGAAAPSAGLTAPVSLLQRSASAQLSPLSALHPRRLSPSMDLAGWSKQDSPEDALRALSGKGKSSPKAPGGGQNAPGARQAQRAPGQDDPTVLRSLPGRAPLATGADPAPASAAATPAGR
ncbi:anti-sigma factor family protein [Streptomyces reniochalinae]|uniref:Zf-HC2 domain-containing protein n=1 Tax=Streptomyces reniochalinae TaxID=2250578 RepID=A0A367EWU7_9ACTN|nr:zf-HC2 domain-containing protein [Streptomyces reniochalinae]RCG22616.1 zf-HC2 domain-containing protein [Streptomyces reniochalinae]